MRVLVTGGAGFIGSNLIRYLIEQDDISSIISLDDFSTGYRENLTGIDVESVEGSILDDASLARAISGADAVVHLAAIPSVPRSIANPMASHHANASGTLSVLEAARHADVETVVVASSSSVYGANPSMPKDELDWTRPMSPYGVSKLATEAYALAYQHSYQMRSLAFRFFNVYGPGQSAGHAYAAVIPRFLTAALSGDQLTVYGDGKQSRDFTYVGTVARAIYSAVREGLTADTPINLAYGTNTTLLELIELLEEALGYKLDVNFEPPRPGDVVASQASPARIKHLLPAVDPVPLSRGLKETIEWFRARTPAT